MKGSENQQNQGLEFPNRYIPRGGVILGNLYSYLEYPVAA